jgi:3-(3-hydroxy-phenyl)propionate hydroxylase
MNHTSIMTTSASTMPAPTANYYHPRKYAAAHYESTPAGEALPVVVVGAGPVGLAAALGVAQRGIKVYVVDSETSASFGSRATCYSRHTLEIAERLGYGDALEQRALGWTGGRSYYRQKEVLNFKMPMSDHDVHYPMYNIGQCEYEDLELGAVDKNPNVTMLWGTTLTGLTTDADGVTLQVESVDGPRTLRAAYVVASDGGRSTVRELMGLRLEGTAYEGRYVIADIHWKSPLPTERRVWFDPPSNPGSTVIMHKQPNNIWRIDYQLRPEEDLDSETTEEAIRARITKHLGWLEENGTITKEPWTLEWHRFYKALSLSLDSYVHGHGRVVFAGDAAHLVPIFGVRGANSGMEDADCLAWMLAAVVKGNAPPSLLQAFSAERHDAWEQNISNAAKSTRIMTPGGDGYTMTRDGLLHVSAAMPEFSHLINPRQSSACHALRSPLTIPLPGVAGIQPGQPLDNRRVGESSLNKLRGVGFGIYAFGNYDKEAVAQLSATLHESLPHERNTIIPLVTGQDGGAAEAWKIADGEVVLVRPDGIILTRGNPASFGPVIQLITGRDPLPAARTLVDPILLTVEEVNRETTWLQVSDALDNSDNKLALLCQLTLILGAEAGPERLAAVLKALKAQK